MTPAEVVLVVLAFAIAISIHESSHAYTAYRCGDSTAKRQGRISMNPIDHIDPVWTVLVPGLLILSGLPPIGAARPVPVNPSNLRNPSRDEALVAAAGPISNFLLALTCGVLTLVLGPLLHRGGLPAGDGLGKLLMAGMTINVLLAVFNLIPIPPLDGSGVLQYFLNRRQVRWMKQNQMMLGMMFVVLWMMGFLSAFISPFIRLTYLIHQSLVSLIWGSGVAMMLIELDPFVS
ncbi:MAG: site-2 protease family protein [bacterium]